MLKKQLLWLHYGSFSLVTSQAASFIRQGVNKVLSALAAVIKHDQMPHFVNSIPEHAGVWTAAENLSRYSIPQQLIKT